MTRTLRRIDPTEADTLRAICDLLDVMQKQGKLVYIRYSPSNVIISWNLIWEILLDLYNHRLDARAAFNKIKSSCFRSPRESQLGAADVIVFKLAVGFAAGGPQGYKFTDVLCIEAKSPTGKQSEEQKKWQKMAEAVGAKYLIARSLDDVIKCL